MQFIIKCLWLLILCLLTNVSTAAVPSYINITNIPPEVYPPGYRPDQCRRASTDLWNHSNQNVDPFTRNKAPALSNAADGLNIEVANPLCLQIGWYKFPEKPEIPYAWQSPMIALDYRYIYYFSYESSRPVSITERIKQRGSPEKKNLIRPQWRPFKGFIRYQGDFQLGFNVYFGKEGYRVKGEMALFMIAAALDAIPERGANDTKA